MPVEAKHIPAVAQIVALAVFGWIINSASGQMALVVETSRKLPVVEAKLEEQDRRINRLEVMDHKLDRLAENMAGVMGALKVRP